MSDRFEKFTERARKVLTLAQQEAQRLNHHYIGTEHILLGLVREGDGVAGRVLANMGVELHKVRSEVQFIIGRGDRAVTGEIGLTPRAKTVIELAVDEARRLNHHYVGTEHLLLGLVREGQGIAAGVLENMGASLEKVRHNVIEVLNQSNYGGPPRRSNQTPVLDTLGVDLNEEAYLGKLDPVVGREQELERIIQILSRRSKSNPILIGEPGVGKTALVHELARCIVNGNVSGILFNKRVVAIDPRALLSGLRPDNASDSLKERLLKIFEEAERHRVILYIDEPYQLDIVAAERPQSLVSTLRTVFAHADISIISETTIENYRQFIQPDAVLGRYFQPVMVEEPSVEQAREMLAVVKGRYEEFHHLTINQEALEAATKLSAKYIKGRYLPDKALDLLDEAASRVSLANPPNSDLRGLLQGIESVSREKEAAFAAQQFELAAELRDKEEQLRARLKEQEALAKAPASSGQPAVTAQDVITVVAAWTGLPLDQLKLDEPE